ncbi:MAG: (d)CMP kinase [Phycisphaerales bacterium]
MIVTIDGPAGTGKSTVAFMLAQRLGLEFLDTGAMYRAITLEALARGERPDDRDSVTRLASEVDVRFDFDASPPILYVDGRPVGDRIRAEDVTAAVSIVASHPGVRDAMVRAQQEIARAHPRIVTEGRDQGTVVFPDAELKIYLDARADVRAQRRALQLRSKRMPADEAAILRSILERDRLDSTRSTGRLARAGDAVLVDTSDLTTDAVVDRLVEIAQARLATLLAVEGDGA